jgi:ribosomal protein L22
MTKITIEHDGGLRSVFEWQKKIDEEMADALREAIRSATGEPDMSTMICIIAKIRQATGLNEKPMLADLPDAIADLMDKQVVKVEEWRTKYDNLARTAMEQASSLARENNLLRDELRQIVANPASGGIHASRMGARP